VTSTLSHFLESKGAIGILAALQEHGKTYTEIEPSVLITSSTISERTDEAIEIGLIERAAGKRQDRTLTEYRLTDYGEAVVRDLSKHGVVSAYRDMRDHHRTWEEKQDEFTGWANDNPARYVGFFETDEDRLPERDSEPAPSMSTDNDDNKDADSSSEHVVRPHPDDRSDEPSNDAAAEEPDTEADTTDDAPTTDAQSQLSDSDIQDKMQEAAENTNQDTEE